jgi:hypothetical protein
MLSIGITGHRCIVEVDRLEIGIHLALERIEQSFPGAEWNLISSLAEGADRLALMTGWKYKPGTHLIVPLPLPVEDYERDFQTMESRQEFRALLERASEVINPTPARTRRDAYRDAGLRNLERAHILLALWDGKSARGCGGTGQVVAQARVQGLPLAWVHCGNSTSLDENQGWVSFEMFP